MSQEKVDLEPKWYVIHTYSGYENKVKADLEKKVKNQEMEEFFFDIVVPMEEQIEIKDGKRKTNLKKVFPGYVLIKMIVDNIDVDLDFKINIRRKLKWSSQTIKSILKDEVYIGNMVQFKTTTVSYKNHTLVYNDEEVTRIATQTNTTGVISRYENRNDILSSDELENIAETYIKYKGNDGKNQKK